MRSNAVKNGKVIDMKMYALLKTEMQRHEDVYHAENGNEASQILRNGDNGAVSRYQ